MNQQAHRHKTRSLMEIHGAVFLFGFSGLFGKLVLLPAPIIVLGRTVFAAISLLVIIRLFNIGPPPKEKKELVALGLLGILLAVHWTTFFKSVQVSTVAIAVLCCSTFPVFTAFIEPLFSRQSIRAMDIVIALIAFSGVGIVVFHPSRESGTTEGVIWGVIAGFAFAVLSVLNRRFVRHYSSLHIACFQNVVSAVFLFPLFFVYRVDIGLRNMILLLVLGVFCTALAHTLFINGMKHVSTRVASVIHCLEPPYGIVLAALILGETPGLRALFGGVVILGSALYATVRMRSEYPAPLDN
jgi:drug/metabolite transporter (DMT)-like permease